MLQVVDDEREHRIEGVRTVGGGYRVDCRCDWTGRFATSAEAVDAYLHHLRPVPGQPARTAAHGR